MINELGLRRQLLADLMRRQVGARTFGAYAQGEYITPENITEIQAAIARLLVELVTALDVGTTGAAGWGEFARSSLRQWCASWDALVRKTTPDALEHAATWAASDLALRYWAFRVLRTGGEVPVLGLDSRWTELDHAEASGYVARPDSAPRWVQDLFSRWGIAADWLKTSSHVDEASERLLRSKKLLGERLKSAAQKARKSGQRRPGASRWLVEGLSKQRAHAVDASVVEAWLGGRRLPSPTYIPALARAIAAKTENALAVEAELRVLRLLDTITRRVLSISSALVEQVRQAFVEELGDTEAIAKLLVVVSEAPMSAALRVLLGPGRAPLEFGVRTRRSSRDVADWRDRPSRAGGGLAEETIHRASATMFRAYDPLDAVTAIRQLAPLLRMQLTDEAAARVHYEIGVAQWRIELLGADRGAGARALKSFRTAVALSPRFGRAHLSLALLCLDRRDRRGARKHARHALALGERLETYPRIAELMALSR